MSSEQTTLPEREDTRDHGPMTGTVREVLDHWIDTYRETVLLKVAGLDAEQLCERAVPPSTMSLIGLVRHLTEVEAYWVRVVVEGDEDVPDYYCSEGSRDGDFDDVSPATALADVATYEREIADTREILSDWDDLDALARGKRRGASVNLAWILTHLVEEYARHLGHMDLLRERVDGRTGY
ncbi:MAG: DinB family protein [Nocardioides sp.]|uniref:DinB family protein n=1 Tax=Nocardioides sp. TaxID=35761 RepID=UPI0039E594AF